MQPPKCNICGHAHWKTEPHRLPKPTKKKRDRRKYARDYYDTAARERRGHKKRLKKDPTAPKKKRERRAYACDYYHRVRKLKPKQEVTSDG